MTSPAAHAETILGGIYSDERDFNRTILVADAVAALDALVAQAERAAELEAERDALALRLRDAPLGGDGSHWVDCWRSHIDCAGARVAALEAERDEWTHETLLAVGREREAVKVEMLALTGRAAKLEAALAATECWCQPTRDHVEGLYGSEPFICDRCRGLAGDPLNTEADRAALGEET